MPSRVHKRIMIDLQLIMRFFIALNLNSMTHTPEQKGFTIIPDVYSEAEVAAIVQCISQADTQHSSFRKNIDVFAIRRFLHEIPSVRPLIFTPKLLGLIDSVFGPGYCPVKSIYFDKPGQSNWFVAWHQDLTISVSAKVDTPGFGPWTVKQDQFAVQPPHDVLAGIFTIRIHLDDTDEDNGALRVIPGSHLQGIRRPETIDHSTQPEYTCSVPAGGVMIMRPLLMHASNRSNNSRRRRVIHLEFSNRSLPGGLNWAEKLDA